MERGNEGKRDAVRKRRETLTVTKTTNAKRLLLNRKLFFSVISFKLVNDINSR